MRGFIDPHRRCHHGTLEELCAECQSTLEHMAKGAKALSKKDLMQAGCLLAAAIGATMKEEGPSND